MTLIDQQNKLAQGFENVRKLKLELKEVRKQIQDSCMQDQIYYDRYLQIKDLNQLQKVRRGELIDQGTLDKADVLSERLRLEKSNLSEWVRDYMTETNLNTVSIQDSLFEIIPSYSLKPKI